MRPASLRRWVGHLPAGDPHGQGGARRTTSTNGRLEECQETKSHRFFAAVATATVLGAASTSLPAADYSIDPAHSFIEFRIKHLGYAWLYGRVSNTVSGSFSHDSANPGGNAISVDIDPASVDTNHAERDKHLRSADFLEVDKYASAGFKSTGYVGNADSGIITGDLTLKGVTKSVDI